MKDSKLYSAAKKYFSDANPSLDVDHYMEQLSSFPEDKWFSPNNKVGDHFTICRELHAAHLIAVKTVPVWRNGSMTGIRVEFFYNKELHLAKAQSE